MKKIFIVLIMTFISSFSLCYAAEEPSEIANMAKQSDAKNAIKPLKNITTVETKPISEIQDTGKVAVSNTTSKDINIIEAVPGLYVIKIDTTLLKGEIKTHYVVHLTTNEDVYKETKAKLVVNAGFFDPKNEQTVSYLTLDKQQILDPHRNVNLMENEFLKPYMDLILNRSEFRVLVKDGKYKYDIAPHNKAVPSGYQVKHAVQAGPMLLPELKLEEEFFILKKDGKVINESASSLKPYARTGIGIKDNNVYLIIATNKCPMTLEQLANFGKVMHLEKMMAFDGGGSTSLDCEELHIISDKDETARKLKSFLLITK